MGFKATGQIPQNETVLGVPNAPALSVGGHRWPCWMCGAGSHEAFLRLGVFSAQWCYLLVVKLDTKAQTQVLKVPRVKAP